MKGSEAAALLEALCVLLRGRDELPPQTFFLAGMRVVIGELEQPGRPGPRGGMSNAQKQRRKRLREKGVDPDADTAPTPKLGVATPIDTAPTPVSRDTDNRCRDTESDTDRHRSGPRVASRGEISSNSPEGCGFSGDLETTTTTGSRAGDTESDTGPTPKATPVRRNLEEALQLPLLERAQVTFAFDQRGDAFRAQAMCAHEWPELQQLAARFRALTGLAHVQAGPWPNANTKRLVELLAVPHLPSTIEQGFAALVESSWWEDATKRRLGLAGVSPRVLESVLTERAEARPKSATRDLVRRVRAAGGPSAGPEPLATALGRIGNGGGQ